MTTILSSNLKKARLLKPWSQDALAQLAGIDRSLITHAENGTKNLSEDTLDRICMVLGITDIIGLTTDPNFFDSKKLTGAEMEKRYYQQPLHIRKAIEYLLQLSL
jgi:transcriptional regulator with XRE-family HTH domain